ncbi:MAG: metal ABC transporter ATP-binding protein [Hespellia sp.]|nr:metal ABC transporter ATP-binding protein [Hespellia sp.]
MSLITCKDVSLAYEGKNVISGLDFSVESGDYLCIVGENGSGKSTLIKALLRLKSPSAGVIETGEELLASEIGYLPQQTIVQKDFPASVYEVVLSGCLNRLGRRPFYGKAEKKMAQENMKHLDISDIQRECYRDLSGGQQQRVLLARALCATKKLLLLDEPVAGLDPVVTQELYQLIKKINKELGITIVMVSHDMNSIIKDASHILHLKNDNIFFGTTAEYEQTSIGEEFIGGEERE